MGNTFSPQEILRIAVAVEEKGYALYRRLEKNAKDEKLKSLWGYLKEQEDLHRQTFEEMIKGGDSFIINEFSSGEYEAYLRAVASEYIFTRELIEAKLKEDFTSALAAVEFAIYIEKESIFTYSSLREYILTSKQPVLDRVIEEERRHLVDLVVLKDFLKKGE